MATVKIFRCTRCDFEHPCTLVVVTNELIANPKECPYKGAADWQELKEGL